MTPAVSGFVSMCPNLRVRGSCTVCPPRFFGSCVRRRRATSVAVSQSTISAHGAPPAPASLACVPCRLTRRPPVGLIVHDYDKLKISMGIPLSTCRASAGPGSQPEAGAKAPAPTVHINDSSSEDVDSTSKDSCAPAHHCNTESRMMPGPTNAVQQAAALLNAGAQHHVRNVILDLEKAANHLLPDIGSVPPVPGRSQAKILAHRRVVFHRLSPLRERTFHFINLRCIQFGKS